MTEARVVSKTKEAHAINAETQTLIEGIQRKDRWFRRFLVVTWSILLVVAIFGIYKQVTIANQSKQHIDCIVKLFTTPLPANARSRTLVNPSTTCNIRFSK